MMKASALFQYQIRRLILSRSHEIGGVKHCIALKFARFGNTAAEVPIKFQSDRTILNRILAASKLHTILRWDVLSDIEAASSLYEEFGLRVIYTIFTW